MRILFLSTTFPDASATTRGTYNSALCRELAVDHDVHIVAPRTFTEALPRRLRGQRFHPPEEVHAAGISVDYPTYWYTPRICQARYGDQMWWSVKSTVCRVLDRVFPDVVLSYWAHPEGAVGVRAAQRLGIPAAVIVGGTDVLILPHLAGRGPQVRRALLDSHAVFTVSDGLRRVVTELGVPIERVHTVYQGIDPQTFHHRIPRSIAREKLWLPSDVPQLVWIGRMVPVKALPVLIEAVRILRDQDVALQLNLIGDGPEQPAIMRLVREAALANQVRFVGPVGHDRLADWIRAADLSVLTSDSEGLPNVLRESLACGTPFVSTDVGSVREIFDERCSALVEKRNPAAVANGIQCLLTDEAKAHAARYQPRTWSDCAQETAARLTELTFVMNETEDLRQRSPSLATGPQPLTSIAIH